MVIQWITLHMRKKSESWLNNWKNVKGPDGIEGNCKVISGENALIKNKVLLNIGFIGRNLDTVALSARKP